MHKLICTLGLTFFLGMTSLVSTLDAEYSRLAVCTHHNYETGVITFTDNCGNDWEWEREAGETFEVGKAYRLIMDDRHSSDIHDDWIKKVKEN